MSTAAGRCGSCVAAGRRVAGWGAALVICAVLACACQWIERPCQAQAAAPQNAAPAEAPADPPPSLVKHPKPPPAQPAPPAATPAPQSGSTATPPEQVPAAQSRS